MESNARPWVVVERWVIRAHRGAGSILGAAEALAKDVDGKVMHFDSREAAQVKVAEWRKGINSRNVWYTVEEG